MLENKLNIFQQYPVNMFGFCIGLIQKDFFICSFPNRLWVVYDRISEFELLQIWSLTNLSREKRPETVEFMKKLNLIIEVQSIIKIAFY